MSFCLLTGERGGEGHERGLKGSIGVKRGQTWPKGTKEKPKGARTNTVKKGPKGAKSWLNNVKKG